MRTTVALDDDLLAKARALTGLKETSALIREALKALIERGNARRLARLGGSETNVAAAPLRRSEPESILVDTSGRAPAGQWFLRSFIAGRQIKRG